jgi:hypothetical protein
MKSIILLISFISLSFGAAAHEYFFAFAEVNHNDKSGKLEATVISSAHETEDALNIIGITIKELEDHYNDSVMIQKLEAFINEGFSMQFGDVKAQFELIGYEVNTKGMVQFYLVSQFITLTDSYTASFDLLMDQFPDQQNKLLFNSGKKEQTAVFLPNKRSEIIKL